MDKEKAAAYEIVGNMFGTWICKIALVVAVILGWAVLIVYFMKNPTAPAGVTVANVPILMMVLIQHFFPKKGK